MKFTTIVMRRMGAMVAVGQDKNELHGKIGQVEQSGIGMANDNFKAGEMSKALNQADPISIALQRLHDTVVTETLPDSFLALLDQIDDKIGASDPIADPDMGVDA